MRKTFIDIFVALTELRKNYCTHWTTKKHVNLYFRKKQRKFWFAQENNANFYLHVASAFDNCQLLDAEMW